MLFSNPSGPRPLSYHWQVRTARLVPRNEQRLILLCMLRYEPHTRFLDVDRADKKKIDHFARMPVGNNAAGCAASGFVPQNMLCFRKPYITH